MTNSHATGLRSLVDPSITHPLRPPLTGGCPDTQNEHPVPLEVTYDYDAVDPATFEPPTPSAMDGWQATLPPVSAPPLGAGDTPLVAVPEIADWAGTDTLYLKNESANPTWSHKDRLNRLTVSGAVDTDARGIVAASTGNHGASAAAYAARAGLPCVVFTKTTTPEPMQGFVQSYGAGLLRVDSWDASKQLVNAFAEGGWHAVTSRTAPHTGHPYGPEGYKPIAYELHAQLAAESDTPRVPGSVVIPVAHAELLYGVWKGFRELRELGVTDDTPTMVACEPGTQASLTAARECGEPITTVDAGPSEAHSIGGSTSTHRGYLALEESDGVAVPVPESTMVAARDRLTDAGFWQELSGAAGVGGLRATDRDLPDPVVAVACSSGFKDGSRALAPEIDTDGDTAQLLDETVTTLADRYDMDVTVD